MVFNLLVFVDLGDGVAFSLECRILHFLLVVFHQLIFILHTLLHGRLVRLKLLLNDLVGPIEQILKASQALHLDMHVRLLQHALKDIFGALNLGFDKFGVDLRLFVVTGTSLSAFFLGLLTSCRLSQLLVDVLSDFL